MKRNKPKVLAIIPARGGSKGLPRKNIRNLCGKPLIAYSIKVALQSELVNRVIVSTEDEEIAEISKHFGAEIPFLRPKEMARDHSSVGDGIGFTVTKLSAGGYSPNVLVTLYPTHPFRTPGLIDFLVDKTLSGYKTVQTVKMITHTEQSIFSKNNGESIVPLLKSNSPNRTAVKRVYFREYGLFQGTNFGASGKHFIHIIKDQVSLIDIDSLCDFYLAEEVIKRGLFDLEADK